MAHSPLRVFRVQCEDETQFLSQVASRIARKGLFLEAERLDPVGTPIRLRLELEPAGRVVIGDGLVVRHGFGARRGEVVRLVRLDPAGLQFDLGDAFAGEPTTPPYSVRIAPADPLWRLGATPQPRSSVPELRVLGPEGWVGGLRPFDEVGPYQLLRRLGSGRFAEVYLAHGAKGLVALRMALPDFGPGTAYGDQFEDEARIGALLSHPNLVQVLDVGEGRGRLFVAAEYVRGWTVAQILDALRERARPPDTGFAVAVALETSRALEHVHGRRSLDGQALGLAHREVRAGNVHVSERGEVKLADFGLPSGAPGRRDGPPSPEWDVRDLGLLLMQMLTLQPPGPQALLEPPSAFNADCPPVLDELVLSCLKPEGRPPAASEVRERLEQIAAASLPGASPATLGADLLGEQVECERQSTEGLLREAARRKAGKGKPRAELLASRARGAAVWAAAAGILVGLLAVAAIVAARS